jgi:hypothetical protein
VILGGLGSCAGCLGLRSIGRRKSVRRYVAETPRSRHRPSLRRRWRAGPVVTARRCQHADRSRASAARSVVRAASSADCRPAAARRRSVALPARVPENYAERDALMKRMISAKPDRANPFTDRGARTKRAR